MVDSKGNKYNHWMFTIQAVRGSTLPGGQTVARALTLIAEKYIFQLEKATSLHYQGCMKTRIRKRQQTVLNELIGELDIQRASVTLSPMRGSWEQARAYCTKSDTSLGEVYTNEVTYSGKDIQVLDEPDRRFPWQQKVINFILTEDETTVKDADDRSIIWLTDSQGNTGKSKLVKWLSVHFDNIVKVSFGTAGQLRSSLVAAGARKVYIIDMPRTLGTDDSINSLVSACEDLKNGFLVSNYYGKYEKLVLDPPHVVIFSNAACPEKLMSSDRWIKLAINYEKDLIKQLEDGLWVPL